MKHLDMSATLKTTLAKENLEMQKLEKSKRAHIRMIASSGAKVKMKQNAQEPIVNSSGDVDAKNIRMYETHVPGFCYLRNGECRKRTASMTASSIPDPVQCSEKVKSLLFTENELDVYKTVCLYLLGTHVQSKTHIQRKDGRLCSYVKAQTMGNIPHTLQPFSQRVGVNANKASSKYDKMLPRYILDVKFLSHGASSSSLRTYDYDNGSDEETKRRRKLQVPIYINNEIRMITHSVLEALEVVNSSKYKNLINLVSSPEELRNMLKNEDLHEYIVQLSANPLVTKPTSYDFVMTHIMFDKIPEKGTLESVAQVLEIYDNEDLHYSLRQIQKAIYQRHTELVNSNIIPKGKINYEKPPSDTPRVLNSTLSSNGKSVETPKMIASKKDVKDIKETTNKSNKDEKNVTFNENEKNLNSEKKNSQDVSKKTHFSKNVSINGDKMMEEDPPSSRQNSESDESSLLDENRGIVLQARNSMDSSKYNFQNLSNPQRILFGLKVAALKSKPISGQQLEGKRKIDLSQVLTPILHTKECDDDVKPQPLQNHPSFLIPERKVKKTLSNISKIHTSSLENLTRALLANLRLEISETENKKRINQFMASIS